MGWGGAGATWRSREKGRQFLKVELESIEVMKSWQEAVMLLLKPTSKEVGKGPPVSVAAAMPVVVVGASVAELVEFFVEADVEVVDDEEIARFLRSSLLLLADPRVQSTPAAGGGR